MYFCYMRKGVIYCFLLVFLLAGVVRGQYDLLQNYDFHPPLKIPLVLAANFGELRSNHFHTGLDFKTNRQEGLNIFSIDDGYVSRIKVSPWGYGQVIYIDHYNGLTSVYAHCSDFVGEIKQLVSEQQRKQENFAFEYYPTKDSLRVKKGQAIALSGNTGGSTAPHLHFEIRETETEHALNPLLFGFNIQDTRKPVIRGLKVYGLTNEGYRVPRQSKTLNVSGSNGRYAVHGNEVTVPASFTSKSGGIGFSFDAIDQLDAAENICGIFQAFLLVDGDTLFSQDMTEISFETNRYINCHKDYEEFHQRGKHFQKTYKTIHNPLPIYRTEKNNGILSTKPGASHLIQYICLDTEGNKSELKFTLKISEGELNQTIDELFTPSDQYLFPDSAFMAIAENYSVLFPPGLLYEPTVLILKELNGINFGSSTIPLQSKFRVMLRIEESTVPAQKHLVTRMNNKGRIYAEGGTVHEGWITTWVKDFGKFAVAIDTLPPEIYAKNFTPGSNVRGKQLFWRIRDNLSGIQDYDIYVDGVWHVLQYEPKHGSKFFFDVPKELQGSKNLRIRVEDACGNIYEEEYLLNF